MTLWPFGVYCAIVILLVAAILAVSHLLGERHSGRATGAPYEGGILSEGSARLRFSVKYYLVAMLFVIFDLEAVFLLAWAIAGRDLGWNGYAAMIFFTVTLVAALVYLWRAGALDWSPSQRARQRGFGA